MRRVERPQPEYPSTGLRSIPCACEVAFAVANHGRGVSEFVSAAALVSGLHSGDGIVVRATLLCTPLVRQVGAAAGDLANLVRELSRGSLVHQTSACVGISGGEAQPS